MAAVLGNVPAANRAPALSPGARKRRTATGNDDAAIGGSPKRFSDGTSASWNEAPSPAAPFKDMSLAKLTHAYQHLADQAAFNKTWVKTVETAITDLALWLDRHSQAGDSIMHQVEQRPKRQFDAVTTTATAQPADTTDAQLRNHVQAQDAAVTARLDKAEAALQATPAALDGTLRAHTQDAVGATQAAVEAFVAQVHLLETARDVTGSSPQTAGTPQGRWRGDQDPVAGRQALRSGGRAL
jgi:hypothetical protein